MEMGLARPASVDAWNAGRMRIDGWLARRLLAGWTPQAVALASGGQITVRTAYRWRASLVALERVQIGGHIAEFVIRRDRPPARISDWRPA